MAKKKSSLSSVDLSDLDLSRSEILELQAAVERQVSHEEGVMEDLGKWWPVIKMIIDAIEAASK